MKKYLYKAAATGDWVFGVTTTSFCPAGVYRLETKGTTEVNIIGVSAGNSQGILSRYDQYADEAGNRYASLAAFVTATKDFFTSTETKLVDGSGNMVNPAGTPATDSVELTRPDDTTAYDANDCVSSAINVAQVDTVTLLGTSGTATVTGTGGLTKTITFTPSTIAQIDTVTLTGTSGTANITVAGGLTKLVTFNTSLTITASDFVTAHAAAYLVEGIIVTSNNADIQFETNDPNVAFAHPVITNATGDLDGTVANDVEHVSDLEMTGAQFVADFENDYLAAGVTLTSDEGILTFTAPVAGTPFVSPVITNVTGGMDGIVSNDTANVTAAALEFENMAIFNGGGGILMEVKVETDILALAAKTLRLWFFNESPTLYDDNEAYLNMYADNGTRLFYVDVTFNAAVGSSDIVFGTATDTDASKVAREYKCADTSLFVIIQTIDAFTPTAEGKINVTLNVLKLS